MSLTPIVQIYTSDPTIYNSAPAAYALTEHNRQPIQISYDRIENSSRMANGTMRRFITANKKKIAFSWTDVPAAGGINYTADGNLGAAWLKDFYEENVFYPIWIKLTYAQEDWTFGNSNTVNSTSIPAAYQANNQTFKETVRNTSAPYAFPITSIALSAVSGGSAVATVTTRVNNGNLSTGDTIYIQGINQIFNGTWASMTDTGTTTLTFPVGASTNSQAIFKINSYNQNGSSATFNTDNNGFIQTGASITISNAKNITGDYINGGWTVTGKSGQTAFTASWSGTSQTARGEYGDAAIITSASFSITAPALTDCFVGKAVTTDILKVFITNFSYNIKRRLALTDHVDMDIEFTEI